MGLEVLCWVINIYLVICVARVILSFIQVDESSIFGTISTFAWTLTEPIFATVRRVLPTPGELPIDFAPAVVMFGLFFVRAIVCGAA